MTGRLRWAGRGLVLLAIATLSAGSMTALSAEAHPAVATDHVSPALSRVDQGALARDEMTAVNVLDRYWSTAFPATFGKPYTSPVVSGGYLGRGGPSCDGAPSLPNNAFYCPTQDFLAWDENLMAAGYETIGDGWVYLIIAHEWGHAVQARLARSQVSEAAELQADCLAGAALYGAARAGLVEIDHGETDELWQTLAAIADDPPWASEKDHGNATERINAFNRGREAGANSCLV